MPVFSSCTVADCLIIVEKVGEDRAGIISMSQLNSTESLSLLYKIMACFFRYIHSLPRQQNLANKLAHNGIFCLTCSSQIISIGNLQVAHYSRITGRLICVTPILVRGLGFNEIIFVGIEILEDTFPFWPYLKLWVIYLALELSSTACHDLSNCIYLHNSFV